MGLEKKLQILANFGEFWRRQPKVLKVVQKKVVQNSPKFAKIRQNYKEKMKISVTYHNLLLKTTVRFLLCIQFCTLKFVK